MTDETIEASKHKLVSIISRITLKFTLSFVLLVMKYFVRKIKHWKIYQL